MFYIHQKYRRNWPPMENNSNSNENDNKKWHYHRRVLRSTLTHTHTQQNRWKWNRNQWILQLICVRMSLKISSYGQWCALPFQQLVTEGTFIFPYNWAAEREKKMKVKSKRRGRKTKRKNNGAAFVSPSFFVVFFSISLCICLLLAWCQASVEWREEEEKETVYPILQWIFLVFLLIAFHWCIQV